MKINYYSIIHAKIIACLLLLSVSFSYGQEDSEISDLYVDYVEPAREVVYMHLNKSTYIKGETVGFKAYVLDKKDKKTSQLTTNLYVRIEDENNKVLKQKLIKVKNGVSSNTFELDSLFTSGYYQVKAYTNWMLNFKEQNYFTETIRVIDTDREKFIKKDIIANKIDAQFLPESGHLLNGVVNTVGVVIKDQLGYGVPFAKGEVLDQNNNLITNFETNQFGIGKFPLLADINDSYSVKLNHNNKEFSFKLNHQVQGKGIIMSLKHLKSKVFVSLVSNEATLETIKGKRHSLMIHNGDKHNVMDVYFTDDTIITKALDYESIATGVNILTLFNENDKPIAERLFFNYDGIRSLISNDISATRANDSVTLNLNFKSLNTTTFNSISVSVLPKETESYKSHHNIISYTYLQPYVNGPIEQAKYYFTEYNTKKQYELDNLLLTQGWSSYNWDNIYKNNLNTNFDFEQGITLNVNVNNKEHLKDTYILHQLTNHPQSFIDIPEGQTSVELKNLYPETESSIFLSRIKDDGTLKPAQLYVQAFPNRIPQLNRISKSLNPKMSYQTEVNFKRTKMSFPNPDNVQNLEEVVVKSKLTETQIRTHKLGAHRYGKVKVVDEMDRASFLTLGDFLSYQPGVSVIEEAGTFVVNGISEGRQFLSERGTGGMLIFLDDVPLVSTNFLYRWPLDNVDYVEINFFGTGMGARAGRGFIKIYSNFGSLVKKRDVITVQEVKLPLVFSEKKTFYAPKYQYYKDPFYQAYGTVDWKPELSTDNMGNISFKIAQPQVPITLFIEGITSDGSFIFEEKTIDLN